ncbi:MAG TPA: type II secretion system protein GspN [Desulfuromonadales bacterium]|nr:type II secretion system protein GspN [Desulfuromonadales bacterium]
MTPSGTLVRWMVLALALPIFFILAIYIFFPSKTVEREIMAGFEAQTLSISPGLHKTFFPGLRWDNPVFSSDRGGLIRFDEMRLTPRLWPLLKGRIVLRATARRGGGRLDADYGVLGEKALDLHASDVKLNDIPFFQTVLGARAGGILWSEGSFTRSTAGLSGGLKLDVQHLELSGVRVGSFSLPDVSNLHSQGMVRVTGNKARLESFTLQGDGIYMRLSGDVPSGAFAANSALNLVLEIMPKPEFIEKQKLVFLLLAKFMTSPGVYQVPIRGTLLKPEIV